MKNKLFITFLITLLTLTVLFFLSLVFSLLPQLYTASGLKAVSKSEIWFAVKLTLFTATCASLLALGLAVPIAYFLARYDFPGKGVVSGILYLPMVVSPIALGAMLLLFFNTPAGAFIEHKMFRIVFEVPGIILAQFLVVIGLAVNLLKSVFEYINPEYENIARSLGASKGKAFAAVLLPLARNGIIAAWLLTWARAVGEFGATVTLAGATPMKTETLPVAIFLSFASADVRSASIYILISLVISLTVVIIIGSKPFRLGGGIK
jgi:molybdate transport system permease protein